MVFKVNYAYVNRYQPQQQPASEVKSGDKKWAVVLGCVFGLAQGIGEAKQTQQTQAPVQQQPAGPTAEDKAAKQKAELQKAADIFGYKIVDYKGKYAALKPGEDLIEGDFASVINAMAAKNVKPSEKQQAQADEIAQIKESIVSGTDKIKKENFINDYNEIQQVQPNANLKGNIEKAQNIAINQLKSFSADELGTLGISSYKRNRLVEYLGNVVYDDTHDTMQGKGIWIVVSNNCEDSNNLANMVTMLVHEANHCDENFISKYPEHADKSSVRYIADKNDNADIMLVNTKAEERSCETLGLLTTAILYKKGIIKEDYQRYNSPVSQYIDANGKPTNALKNDVDNWVSGYTNYPEDMRGNITVEHMLDEKINDVPQEYEKLQIKADDVLVVNNNGKKKQVTLGSNGAVLSPVDSAPIFQLVNADFGGRIIFDELQPTEDEFNLIESRTGELERPDVNNYQVVSLLRNGKEIYQGKLY